MIPRNREVHCGYVARREQLVLAVLLDQGIHQVLPGDRRFGPFTNRPFDGQLFGSLHDGGNDRSAG